MGLKTLTPITNNISVIFLQTMLFLARFLPQAAIKSLGRVFAAISYALAAKQRRMALANIKFCLHLDEAECRRLVKDNFYNIFYETLEIMRYYHLPPAAEKKIYEISGRDNLDKALSFGHGVVAVTAHLGNFPFMGRALFREGYRVNFVMRNLHNKKLEKLIAAMSRGKGVGIIWTYPRQENIRRCIEALRKNEILILLLDQNFGSSGVFVDFFGKAAATAAGPLILARRTGAKILPMFINRLPVASLGKQRITIEDIFEPEKLNERDLYIQKNTQALTRIIEDYVRHYPREWNWIHNRWKVRPKDHVRS